MSGVFAHIRIVESICLEWQVEGVWEACEELDNAMVSSRMIGVIDMKVSESERWEQVA
jgi:hypothetical protein